MINTTTMAVPEETDTAKTENFHLSDTTTMWYENQVLRVPLCSGMDVKSKNNFISITIENIFSMAETPPEVDKMSCQFFIPSTLSSRSHQEQRDKGKFYALIADVDWNDELVPPLTMLDVAEHLNKILPDTKALIYSTKSATEACQKCRIIIPLAVAITGTDFELYQEILNDKLHKNGIIPDRSTERAGQVSFLPNRGEFYYYIPFDGSLFKVIEDWKDEYLTKKKQLEIELSTAEAVKAQRAQEQLKATANGKINVIEIYNQHAPIEAALTSAGYKQIGNKYLSPLSSSKTPGCKIIGTQAISYHDSDSGIGVDTTKGFQCFDAFSLLKRFECGDDQRAALHKAGEMFTTPEGITVEKHNQRIYMAEQEAERQQVEIQQQEHPPEQKNKSRTLQLVRLGDIEFKEPDWLIYGMIEMDSLSLIFGDPGCGKSFVGIDIASCVATGHSFNNKRVKQGSVIYIAGEGQNGLKRRFTAWSIHKNINLNDKPIYLTLIPAEVNSEESINIVKEEMKRIIESDNCPCPVLIVIDTLARNFGSGDENNTKDMNEFIKGVDMLRSFYGSSMIVIHHTGHNNKERARGAISLKGSLDTEIRLDKDKTTQTIIMSCTKQNGPTPNLQPRSGVFKVETAAPFFIFFDGQLTAD